MSEQTKPSAKYNRYTPLHQVKSNLWFGAEEDHCGIPFSSSFESFNHEKRASKLHDVKEAPYNDLFSYRELEEEEELPF